MSKSDWVRSLFFLQVVSVDVTENRTVRSESATKHRELTKVRPECLFFFHTKTVVLLREFTFFSSSLRLLIFVEDPPIFARAFGSANLGQYW